MATWAKPKIYYKTMLGATGSTLTASSTLSGTAITNIYNMLEVNRWEATSTAQQTITYDAGHGQLTNGDFETGVTTGWGLSVGGGAAATFAAQTTYKYEGTYAGRVTITSGGSSSADINIYQLGKSIIKGRRYVCIFHARTVSANKTAYIDIVKSPGDLRQYSDEGAQSISVTSTMTTFKYTFTANATADDVAIRWRLGGNTVDFIIDYATFGEEKNYAADYLAVAGHNLGTASSEIDLQHNDNGVDPWTTDIGPANEWAPNDKVYLKEFTSPGYFRHWRLIFTNSTVAPYLYICVWGLKTELDYATVSFDPNSQSAKANINLSQNGYVTGIHTNYVERQMNIQIQNGDIATYDKLKEWHQISGMKNFFIAWDFTNAPEEVYLMRPSEKWNNPFTKGGLYRNLTLDLKGRRE